MSHSRALLMLLAFVAFQLGDQAPTHFGHGVGFAAGMASIMIQRAKGAKVMPWMCSGSMRFSFD